MRKQAFAQLRQSGANGGAMQRAAIAFGLFAGEQVPGQFVEAGAPNPHCGFLRRRFDARPVELNQSACVIEGDHQPERGTNRGNQIWPRHLGRRQSQFRLRRLWIHELLAEGCNARMNLAILSRRSLLIFFGNPDTDPLPLSLLKSWCSVGPATVARLRGRRWGVRRLVVQIRPEPFLDFLQRHALAEVVIEHLVSTEFAHREIF